jgi:RNA 2',3'-cyclic 3'-phosphodiesterase
MEALNRCSIGFRLPPEGVAALSDVQLQVKRRAGAEQVRWTPPSEIFLTLLALGEIQISTLAAVRDALPDVAGRDGPLWLKIDGLGGTPTVLQPRMIYAGVGGDVQRLADLHADLMQRLRALLPDHQQRPLPAHVPIGRSRDGSEQSRTALGRAIRMAQPGDVAEWTAREIELVRYTSGDTGPQIETVAQFPLNG